MTKTANIHEAKTHLSKLLKQVAEGEEVVIARAGKPVAKLVPFEKKPRRRQSDQWKGLVRISDDFDAPLPDEIAKAFRGEGP